MQASEAGCRWQTRVPAGWLCSAGPLKALSRVLSGVTRGPACFPVVTMSGCAGCHTGKLSPPQPLPENQPSLSPCWSACLVWALNHGVPTPGLPIQQVWDEAREPAGLEPTAGLPVYPKLLTVLFLSLTLSWDTYTEGRCVTQQPLVLTDGLQPSLSPRIEF